jgi:hypothetical protein
MDWHPMTLQDGNASSESGMGLITAPCSPGGRQRSKVSSLVATHGIRRRHIPHRDMFSSLDQLKILRKQKKPAIFGRAGASSCLRGMNPMDHEVQNVTQDGD